MCTYGIRTLTLVLGAVLAGCTGNPKQVRVDNGFEQFYDSQAAAAYATELPAQTAAEALAKGDRALHGGDADLALYRYVQALQHDRKHVAAFYRIGGIHLERENYPLAQKAFGLGVEVDPTHPGVQEGLGLALLHQRRYSDARGHLEKAVQYDIRRWRSHNALGVIADLNQDFVGAAAAYGTALRLVPDSPLVLNNLGYSEYLAGRDEAALGYLRRAVTHNPNYRQGWRNLGLVYARMGRYDEALAAFERVGSRAAAYNNIGYVCLNQRKYENARHYLKKAATLSPRYYETAYENMEKLERAMAL